MPGPDEHHAEARGTRNRGQPGFTVLANWRIRGSCGATHWTIERFRLHELHFSKPGVLG